MPAAQYSFGGWKDSLFGDTRAAGPDAVHFFTRVKVITTRLPDATTLDPVRPGSSASARPRPSGSAPRM